MRLHRARVGLPYPYTSVKNTVSQTPKLMKLLPVELGGQGGGTEPSSGAHDHEPDAEGVLDSIVQKYI